MSTVLFSVRALSVSLLLAPALPCLPPPLRAWGFLSRHECVAHPGAPGNLLAGVQLPTDEYLDKRRFQLQLSSRWRQQEQLQQLRVSVLPPPVGMPTPHGERVLLQGDLGGRVRDWGEGSFWELVRSRLREGSTTEGSGGGQLVLTLEKMQRAASAKFDFWQSCFQGPEHPLIDTHRLARDGSDVMAPSVGAGPAGGPVTREDVMAQLRSRQGLMLNEEQMAALEGWQALHRSNSSKGDWRKMR